MGNGENRLLLEANINNIPFNLQKQSTQETHMNVNDSLFIQWKKNVIQEYSSKKSERNDDFFTSIIKNSKSISLSEDRIDYVAADKDLHNELVIKDFEKLSRVFSYREKGRSESYYEVVSALRNFLNSKGQLLGKVRLGQLDGFSNDQYAKYIRLNEALTSYISKHVGARWKAGKERLNAAYKLRNMLAGAARLTTGKLAFIDKDDPVTDVTEKETVDALKNIDNMSAYYRSYCKQISEDMVSTEEEKIWARWNVLKTCERDIRIMREAPDDQRQDNKERVFIENEYIYLKSQIQLLNMRKTSAAADNDLFSKKIHDRAHDYMYGNTIIKEKIENDKILINDKNLEKEKISEKKGQSDSNEGLKKDQLKGLQEIDQWVIRNIRNGGYMTFGRNKTDRTDFASKLLSLSKKERMYIYYLVETKERVKPTMEGLVKSQATYVPNLSAFKGRMIASKLKFHTRFSGGYIHWNKLSEAMAIAGQATKPMEMISEVTKGYSISKNANGAKVNQSGNAPSDEKPVDVEIQRLKNIFGVLIDIMILAEKQEYKGKKLEGKEAEEVQERLRNVLTVLAEDLSPIKAKNIGDIDKNTENKLPEDQKIEKDRYKNMEKLLLDKAGIDTSVGDKIQTVGIYGGEGLGTAYNILSNVQFIASIKSACYSISSGAIGAVSGLIGLIGGILAVKEDYSGMTKIDVAATGAEMVVGVATVVNAAGIITRTVDSTNKVGNIIGSAAAGQVLALAALGLNAIKTTSYLSKGYSRKQASKLAKSLSKKNEKDKFRDGMVMLNRHLGKKQSIASYSGLASSAVAAGILFAPIALPIIAAATIFVTVGQAISVKISNDSFMKKMRADLNNSFFDMEEFMKKTGNDVFEERIKNKKFKDNKQKEELKKKLKKKFERQVMRRISSELGFYSPNHMATAVAMKYADYLLAGVMNENDPEQSNMCRRMIEGLGLQCKLDKGVPRPSDIAKALCG